MSNSPLVHYTKISPNSSARGAKIDTITIHHMAGNLSVEACGQVFQDTSRQASSNYGIGTDGRIGLYVPENRRAWTSSNRDNDNRAITIEVANDGGAPDWHVSDKALESTIALCVDICRRNGIPRLNFTGSKTGSNLTMHKWYAATQCPGPYLESKFPYIAKEVNARLGVSVVPETEEKAEPSPGVWRVQIGAYSTAAGAEWRRKQAEAAGFDAYVVVVDNTLRRVQVGSYDKKADAEAMQARLLAKGFGGTVTTLGGVSETSAPSEPSKSETEEVAEVKVAVLKKGDKGDQVKALQALLIGYGYDVGKSGTDGSFGPATEAAVLKYKQSKGLTGGSTVGVTTWESLLGA